ncbi:MAG: hypothetical protein CBD27_03550 [Rhodospirillaceae bacterium TMED167]|nr:hypothetical protein [Rhodospirillaceae bacterium]OUW29029.1 MAG: hypothetical protein CBD27_03550 [Rhodospirillaceae bacterium TMED167]
MENTDTDVIIVGGGPAGLMLAIELGRRNIRCILFDEDDSTTPNPQANATQARTMEHFRRLGFADEVRAEGMPPDYPTDIAYYTSFSKYELARFKLPSSSEAKELIKGMGGSWSAAEPPHRVSQMYVEKVLQRQVMELASVDLRYRHDVTEVADHRDHVSATAMSEAGETIITGKYLVGCDGPRSRVRKTLGISLQGESGVAREFVGGPMHAVYLRAPHLYDVISGDPAWMHVNINHKRRCFFVALDGKAEFVFHPQLKPGEDKDAISETHARTMFNECMGQEVDIEIISRSSWMAGLTLVAEKMSEGRIFIAGDAAHLFTPTGGLGYNTAIEDVVNLGWKLAAVINGWGGSGLLTSYHPERQPAAVRNTIYAKGFADSLGNFKADPRLEEDSDDGAQLRNAAGNHYGNHGRSEFNIPGITFGTRYDGSPIVVGDGTSPPPDQANVYEPTACPGGRAPHLWFDRETAKPISLYDRFGFEFTLLKLDGCREQEANALHNTAADLHIPLSTVSLPGEEARALYGAELALIRPDQIVAWRGNTYNNGVLEAVNGQDKSTS